MSSTAILNALAGILPTGSPVTIAQVAIQKGISIDAQPDGTPAFPALQLNSPDDRGTRQGIGPTGPWEPIRRVHAKYIDVPGGRTYEQALTDAELSLEGMLGAALSNIKLSTIVNAVRVDNCVEILGYVKHLDEAITDIGLGFPTVNGYIILDIKDFWSNYTQTI